MEDHSRIFWGFLQSFLFTEDVTDSQGRGGEARPGLHHKCSQPLQASVLSSRHCTHSTECRIHLGTHENV